MTMSGEDMTQITINVDKLGEVIAKHMPPIVPVDEVIWGASECAAWLLVSVSCFQQKYAPQPSFPAAIRATTSTGKSHPRWKAAEVRAWFFAHGEAVERRRRTRKK